MDADLARVGGEATDVVLAGSDALPALVTVRSGGSYAVVAWDGPDRERREIVTLSCVTAYLEREGAVDHEVPLVLTAAALEGLRVRRADGVVVALVMSDRDGPEAGYTGSGSEHAEDDR